LANEHLFADRTPKQATPIGTETVMTVKPTAVIKGAAQCDRESWADAARGNASWFTLFSSDITPTSAMCAGIMEIPPNGGTLEAHRHQQAEIYFVFEGTGLLTIDGAETTITPGEAAFIPGDAEHSVRNDEVSVLKIFYVFPTDRFADVVYLFPDPSH
jgi:mannose-6-phosphate isomerase-like protein (cupin superfamily)